MFLEDAGLLTQLRRRRIPSAALGDGKLQYVLSRGAGCAGKDSDRSRNNAAQACCALHALLPRVGMSIAYFTANVVFKVHTSTICRGHYIELLPIRVGRPPEFRRRWQYCSWPRKIFAKKPRAKQLERLAMHSGDRADLIPPVTGRDPHRGSRKIAAQL